MRSCVITKTSEHRQVSVDVLEKTKIAVRERKSRFRVWRNFVVTVSLDATVVRMGHGVLCRGPQPIQKQDDGRNADVREALIFKS